jgi:hypothetical protein
MIVEVLILLKWKLIARAKDQISNDLREEKSKARQRETEKKKLVKE